MRGWRVFGNGDSREFGTREVVVSLYPDLSERSRQPELMDQPGLGADRHRSALRALAKVNRLSLTARRIWLEIRCLACESRQRPLRILDVACGGGDVAIDLKKLSVQDGVPIEVGGCDASPLAVQHAGERAEQRGFDVRFFELDVIEQGLPEGYDVICSSLFLHHLDEKDAVDLLRRTSGAAKRMVLIQDLIRSRMGYALAWAGVRLLSRSDVARTDGSLSVLSAFTIDEAQSLADQAGLRGARIARCWPQRFKLVWTAT